MSTFNKTVIIELDGKVSKIRSKVKGWCATKDWIHVSHEWGVWSIPIEHVTDVEVLK